MSKPELKVEDFDKLTASNARGGDQQPSPREVWAMIRDRWRWVAIIACLIAAGSAAAALLYAPRFSYTSSIEIGVIVGLIESPETVAAKLQETYLPQVRSEYLQAHPDQIRKLPRIEVRVPRGSALVVVESRGTSESAQLHESLHQAAIALLEADHARVVDVKRQALEANQAEAQRRVQEQQDQIEFLKAASARIDATERLLEQQRVALSGALTQAERDRAAAAERSNGDRDTSALLIIDQEILRAKDRLLGVNERLAVGLRAERSTIAKSMNDAERLRSAQLELIDQIKNELTNLRTTRALAVAHRSDLPVGLTPLILFGLGTLGGLLIGIFVAVISGLVQRDRVRASRPPG
jgi:hypothetical protein